MRRAGMALLIAAACGSRGHGELAGAVDRHCRGTTGILRAAVESHAAGENDSVELGDLRDGEVSTRLFRDLMFCLEARRADAAEVSRLSVAAQGASQAMRTSDRAARQAAMSKMLELFSRMNELPLRR